MIGGYQITEQRITYCDVVVIGTGMGGATVGYELARSGKNVIFCERGRANWKAGALRGNFAEMFTGSSKSFGQLSKAARRSILARSGRFPDEIIDRSGLRAKRFTPFIGCGTGGSSAVYGAALERFFPSDFTPGKGFKNLDGSSLPQSWPIGFQDLKPFYESAESMYHVRGGKDPLRNGSGPYGLGAPSTLSKSGRYMMDLFSSQGLHPYQLPTAHSCSEEPHNCQGFLCEKRQKFDSVKACLQPAIELFGARLLDECEVLKLESDGDEVTNVLCSWQGEPYVINAETVIVAAGALETPRLLLKSASDQFPIGLANSSGLVGRNLMRHYVDLWVAFPDKGAREANSHKEIGLNDFYHTELGKLGSLQSFGPLPPGEAMLAEPIEQMENSGIPLLASMMKAGERYLGRGLSSLFAGGVVFASLMEDLPFFENRVALADPSDTNARLEFSYKLSRSERVRIKTFRSMVKGAFRGHRAFCIKQAENNMRLAHVCGTCRFGDDPGSSVLDRNCRTHDLKNLYVVDSSFFPSSAGINPGLTIAANALRVAQSIINR